MLKPRITTNYWLSMSLALLSLTLALSALLLWVIFPKGYYPSRVVWVEIHKWVGLSLSIGVLVHIALHWRWLRQMTRHYWRRLRRKID